MDVACTLVCPNATQEVIITHPSGNETQKCEKCDGDCPKGGIFIACYWVASIFVAAFPRVHLRLIIQSIMWQRLSACRPVLEVELCQEM